MLAPLRPPPQAWRALRLLHTTPRACNRVGPPDPVSNLRPVLHDDPLPPCAEELRHPYSLSEFRGGDNIEYQWKLQRQQLDAWNHGFWTDSNTRFETAKDAVLSSLPEAAMPDARERALADFYKHWVIQESSRQEAYNREWRRRSFEEIKLAARAHYEKFTARLFG